jgi:hypothetical protein
VGAFTDTDTSGTASQFTVTINWGNGTQNSGTVTANGYNGSGQPQFLIGGSNTYLSSGSYTISISIYFSGVLLNTTTATATVVMLTPAEPVDPDAILPEEPWDVPARPLVLAAGVWDPDGWLTDAPAVRHEEDAERGWVAIPIDTTATPVQAVPVRAEPTAPAQEEVRNAVWRSDAVFSAVAEAAARAGVDGWRESSETEVPATLGWEDLTSALTDIVDEVFAGL